MATEIWANNWNDYPVEDPLEYTHSRYTPVVTTDCREFNFDGYTLRVTEMGRKISMLVCITLYNEGQEELDRSLLGVCEVSVVSSSSILSGKLLGASMRIPGHKTGFLPAELTKKKASSTQCRTKWVCLLEVTWVNNSLMQNCKYNVRDKGRVSVITILRSLSEYSSTSVLLRPRNEPASLALSSRT